MGASALRIFLVLKDFLEHFERFAIDCGSTKSSYGSVVWMMFNSSQHLISAELVQSLSSLFPCLELFTFEIDPPAGIEQMIPLLGSVAQTGFITEDTCDTI